MHILRFLQLCSYWLFILYSIGFLALSLVLRDDVSSSLGVPHAFFLYGALLSLLLCASASVSLWVGNSSESEHTLPQWITFGAALLASGMIAVLLFFL